MPTTSQSRIIAAPVREVWAAITDLEAAHRWNEAWQRVEYLSYQREGVGTEFRAHTEDGLAHDFRISEWAQMEYISFAPIRNEDEDKEKRYMLTLESQAFLLRPANDDHTNVTLFATVASHGPRGWFAARIVWPGYQRQGLRSALDALHALFEPQPDEDGQTDPDS